MNEMKRCHRLKSLSVVGGFLDGLRIDFADGLNCLIGGRGTGKTTVIELVRFALDAMPDDRKARKRVNGLLATNLEFGRVELCIETSSGISYVVSRAHDDEPVVMTEDRKPTELTLKSGGLFRADLYSQNDVESIADRSDSQLDLIDSFDQTRIADFSARAGRIALEATGLSKDVAHSQRRIAALKEETDELKNVEEQLKGMAATGTEDAEAINRAHAQRGLRDRENRAMEQLTEKLGGYGEGLEQMICLLEQDARAMVSTDILNGDNRAIFTKTLQVIARSGRQADGHIRGALDALEKCWRLIQEQSKTLTTAHGSQEMAFQEMIEKQQVAKGEANKRSFLEKRRNDLLMKLQEQKVEEEKLIRLEKERSTLLDELAEIRDSRYEQRKAICERLTSAFDSEIKVTVEQDGNKARYRAKLDELLKGSRVQEGSKDKIVDSLFPAEFVRVVRAGDAAGLIEKAGLTETTAGKIVAVLGGNDGLHELETVELVDEPHIELNDSGTWKDSRDLSTGQKCTAILPILLMESEKPLLIDQPEDNLDNRYVSDKVVRTIRSVKEHRQLVFVTHNPNIPVLGDAEQVLVLDSSGTAGRVLKHGSVDHCRDEIVNLLEGGEEAFELRAERYKR